MPDAQPEQMEQRMELFEDILRAWVDDNRGAIEEGAIGNWRTLAEALAAPRPTPDLGDDGELVERLRNGDRPFSLLERAEAADRLILYREALEKIVAGNFNCSRHQYYMAAQEIARAVLSRSRG